MTRGAGCRPGIRWITCTALVVLAASALPVFGAEGGEFKYRMVGRAEGIGFSARRAALEVARQEVIWELLKSKIASGDLRPYRVMVRNAEKYITRTDELHVDSGEDQTRVEIDAIVNIEAFDMIWPRW